MSNTQHDDTIILPFDGAGTGNCLDPNTKVLVNFGEIKRVKDLMADDELMGINSKRRRILSLNSGRDQMFKITTFWGDSFICNKSYILTLRYNEHVLYIPLGNLLQQLEQGSTELKNYKLFRNPTYLPKVDSSTMRQRYQTWPIHGILDFFNVSTSIDNRMLILHRVCTHYFKNETLDNITLEIPDMYQASRVKYLLQSLGIHCRYQKGLNTLITFPGTMTKEDLKIHHSDLEFTIERLGEGEYRGFTLDEDGQFLLSNFIL